MTCLAVLTVLPLFSTACWTTHKDVQYFSVVDELGNQAFYRVRIQGGTPMGKFKLQSGQFSAAAVDVIRGQMPDIPELGLDIEHERVFEETVSLYHMKLLDQGYAMVPDASDRARWLAVMEKVDKTRKGLLSAFEVIEKVEAQKKAFEDAETKLKEAEKVNSEFVLTAENAAKKKDLENAERLARQVRDEEKRKYEEIQNQKPAADRLVLERCSQLKQHFADAAAIGGEELDLTAMDCTNPQVVKQILALEGKPPRPPTETSEPLKFGSANDPGTIDNVLVNLSRLIWYASLSKADLVAMGQSGSNEPNAFRKHVLWVSVQTLNLQEIGVDIDKVISGVVSVARVAKEQSKQRAEQHKAKRAWLEDLLSKSPGLLGGDAAGLVDVLLPETGSSTTTTDALAALQELRRGVESWKGGRGGQ